MNMFIEESYEIEKHRAKNEFNQKVFEYLKENLRLSVERDYSYDGGEFHSTYILSLTDPTTGKSQILSQEWS